MKSRNEKETVPVPSAALEMIHCSFFQPETKNVTTINTNISQDIACPPSYIICIPSSAFKCERSILNNGRSCELRVLES